MIGLLRQHVVADTAAGYNVQNDKNPYRSENNVILERSGHYKSRCNWPQTT
jgi:hypothetical protein